MIKKYLAAAILLFVTFLPIFSLGVADPTDPISTLDTRIDASISNDELDELMGLARSPRWGGIWILMIQSGKALPVLWITDTKVSRILEKDAENEWGFSVLKVIPNGKVQIVLGEVRGRLDGSGCTLIFDKIDDQWVLIERLNWSS